jgi:hypothetical protein
MADNHKSADRTLRHCYEWNRFEEQLWTTAYEQIWPVIRRALQPRPTAQRRHERSGPRVRIARRA